jgi:type 1 glutamine amidotransferase
MVSPVPVEHPITHGIEPFTIDDELYYNHCDPGVLVHLVAQDGPRACPLAWSRLTGQGKVVYFGPGHDEAAWNLPEYQRIIQQCARWLVSRT